MTQTVLGQCRGFRLGSHLADSFGVVSRDSFESSLADIDQTNPAVVQTAVNLTLEECGDALYQMVEKAEQLYPVLTPIKLSLAYEGVRFFSRANASKTAKVAPSVKAWRLPIKFMEHGDADSLRSLKGCACCFHVGESSTGLICDFFKATSRTSTSPFAQQWCRLLRISRRMSACVDAGEVDCSPTYPARFSWTSSQEP